MRKRIIYLIAIVLSISFYASSKDCILTGKGQGICKRLNTTAPQPSKAVADDDLLELSPVTHFLLFES